MPIPADLATFHHSLRNRGPSLDQRYPASSLLHPHPSSAGPTPPLTRSPLPGCPPGTTADFPCCTFDLSLRAATTTPVESSDAFHARYSDDIGLPRYYGESASTTAFRGLLSVHSRCGPQSPLISFETVSRSASTHLLPPEPPLVLPAGAQVGRVGFAPTYQTCLSKAHTTTNVKTRSARLSLDERGGCSPTPRPARAQAPCFIRSSRQPTSMAWSPTPGSGACSRGSPWPSLSMTTMRFCPGICIRSVCRLRPTDHKPVVHDALTLQERFYD